MGSLFATARTKAAGEWSLLAMAEEQALLAAINDNRADDSLRLIYADWLEEQGDVRCEFVRARCAGRNSNTPKGWSADWEVAIAPRIAVQCWGLGRPGVYELVRRVLAKYPNAIRTVHSAIKKPQTALIETRRATAGELVGLLKGAGAKAKLSPMW